MNEAAALLTALQHGDSFFPSGALSFSWGLETLHADRLITTAPEVERFIVGQLRYRWATCDRPALVGAWRAGGDVMRAIPIDETLEALALPREMRDGSRRAGAALLNVHDKLATRGAACYRRLVVAGEAPGHLAVVQGMVWQAVGLPEGAAAAISAHGLCVALLGAALRLGMIGHLDAQRSLVRLRTTIGGILSGAPPPIDRLTVYSPAADIAAMRHETQGVRLFMN